MDLGQVQFIPMKKAKKPRLTAEAVMNAIPSTEAEFMKLILGSPVEFPIAEGIISEVLAEHHATLERYKGKTPEQMARLVFIDLEFSESAPPTLKNLKAAVLRRIAYRAIDEMSDHPHKRDIVISVINSRLGKEHKVSGDTLRRFAAEIAAGRTDRWDGVPIWDASFFTKTYAKKLRSVPTKLMKMAEQDYRYWAIHAPLSEHVLWNDMPDSYSSDGQSSYSLIDELVLLHLVRRILAHVPAGKKRDEMIAACNTYITRHAPATGEVLARLKTEAKGLKKADAERKKEPKKKYVISWTYFNPEKGDSGMHEHGQDSYKNLYEAKEALWQSYSALKQEIDEGGGYFDSYDNEISIDDDGMRYRSSGLIESEREIRTR